MAKKTPSLVEDQGRRGSLSARFNRDQFGPACVQESV